MPDLALWVLPDQTLWELSRTVSPPEWRAIQAACSCQTRR
ncbi:hypothetical protein HMPREF9004_0382 [Schaalia cardiffensis F0333]|uniref:Uncharacterized protein n=1 Tax=Schaalia cardiffensis F0333 TaxID=888050 RepID=N6X5T5_9ACTO|nr:hypothetical protein HMPREF9004_0382 [Schaalia cardiffensis F0333]